MVAMGIGRTLLDWMELRLARFLATRPATPLILTGTLALAGLGAAATNPVTLHQSPAATTVLTPIFPNTSCYADPDGDGTLVCHIPANLVSNYPTAYCHLDWDGDGSYVCHFWQ